jgi:CHAD domain-containing protein
MAKAPRYGEIRADEPLGVLSDAVLRSLWKAMLEEADGALSGEDVEAVHDMRVAIRRLRSALRAFRTCYPDSARKGLAKKTKRLGRQLGVVRDADVHLDALRTALANAAEPDRDGIAYAIEQVGEQRGRALAQFAILLSQFDRDALEKLIERV